MAYAMPTILSIRCSKTGTLKTHSQTLLAPFEGNFFAIKRSNEKSIRPGVLMCHPQTIEIN